MRLNLVVPSANFFYRILFGACVVVTLQCCGSGVTRGSGKALQVALQIPEGEDPDLFWLGTRDRKLRWHPQKGDAREIEWAPGSTVGWEAREGDRIAFEAQDASGRTVVDGVAPVGEEKNVTIPLRRVL